jgi:hypothetical protein
MEFGTFFGPILLAFLAAGIVSAVVGIAAVTIGVFVVALVGGLYLSLTWS